VSEEWYDKCPNCDSEVVNGVREIGGFKTRVVACPACDFYDWEIPADVRKRGEVEMDKWVSEASDEARKAGEDLLRERGLWFKIVWSQRALDLLNAEQKKLVIEKSVKEILQTLGVRRAYIGKLGQGLRIEIWEGVARLW